MEAYLDEDFKKKIVVGVVHTMSMEMRCLTYHMHEKRVVDYINSLNADDTERLKHRLIEDHDYLVDTEFIGSVLLVCTMIHIVSGKKMVFVDNNIDISLEPQFQFCKNQRDAIKQNTAEKQSFWWTLFLNDDGTINTELLKNEYVSKGAELMDNQAFKELLSNKNRFLTFRGANDLRFLFPDYETKKDQIVKYHRENDYDVTSDAPMKGVAHDGFNELKIVEDACKGKHPVLHDGKRNIILYPCKVVEFFSKQFINSDFLACINNLLKAREAYNKATLAYFQLANKQNLNIYEQAKGNFVLARGRFDYTFIDFDKRFGTSLRLVYQMLNLMILGLDAYSQFVLIKPMPGDEKPHFILGACTIEMKNLFDDVGLGKMEKRINEKDWVKLIDFYFKDSGLVWFHNGLNAKEEAKQKEYDNNGIQTPDIKEARVIGQYLRDKTKSNNPFLIHRSFKHVNNDQ